MLPARHRLTRRSDFRAVTRRGARGAAGCLVVHLLVTDGSLPARAGLVVSKSVGGSVVRHRVSRRLRGALTPVMAELPDGACLVIRALPNAATTDAQSLGDDIRRGVDLALSKVQR